ncbi:MAG: tetratricopeptide repeat protein [Gemmataceae bacterium]
MRKVNTRFFVSLVLTTAALTGGLFLLHYFQSGRVEAALLFQANRAEEQGQPEKVAQFLGRYLEFAPDDMGERIRLAEMLSSEGMRTVPKSRDRAIYVIEGVLARDPQRHDMRCQLAKVAMEMRRWDLAREHLNILQTSGQREAEVAHLFGLWYEGQEQFTDAEGAYAKAVDKDAHSLDSYVRRAYVLRSRLGQPLEADKAIDELVANNGDNFKAHLDRWHYRADFGLLGDDQLPQAGKDVSAALKLASLDADVLLAAGEWKWRGGNVKQAKEYLELGVKEYPEDPRFYQALSQVDGPPPGKALEADSIKDGLAKTAKESKAAEHWLRKGLEAVPTAKQFDLIWRLTNLMLNRGELSKKEDAEFDDLVKRLVKSLPAAAPADYLQARRFLNQGRWVEAAQLLEKARPVLTAPPDLANQLNLYLAQCYEQLDDPIQQRIALGRILPRDPVLGTPLKGAQAARVALTRGLLLEALHDDHKDWKEVELALLSLEKAQPQSIEPTLMRVEALAARDRFSEAHELLQKKIEQTPKQIELYIALAAVAERQGQVEESNHILETAQKQCGDKAPIRLARIQFVASRNPVNAAETLAQLAKGRDQFDSADQALLLRTLAEAYQRLGKLREASEYWRQLAEHPRHQGDARVHVVLFDLALQAADKEGMERSLEHVKKIEGVNGTLYSYVAGVRSLWLAKQGQKTDLDEAHRLLSRVVDQRPSWPAGLLALAELEDLRGNRAEASTYYQKAFKFSAYNPLVLGQALAAGGQRPEDVERSLERAAAMAGTVPEAWVAYIQYLARRDRGRAEKAIEEAKAKLADDVKAQALSLCYEAVGKLNEAQTNYEAALAKQPDEVAILRTVANFYLRTERLPEAERLIRRVLDNQIKSSAADMAWAKSGLALVMVARKDYRQLAQAATLVGLSVDSEGNLIEAKDADDSVEGIRARARVLSTQSGKPPRERAISLLEKLDDRHGLTADDRFLLAQLHEAAGNWPRARQIMVKLLESEGGNQQYLVHFVTALLREKEIDEAQQVFAKLEEVTKKSLVPLQESYPVIDLKAQLLEAQNQGDQALALLQKFVARPGARPEDVLLVLFSLGRQKRIDQALDVCDKAWQTCPPSVVGGASVALLREGKPDDKRCARVEERLRAAINAHPDQSAGLLVHLADLLDLRGQYLPAEKQYRLALGRDPDNLVALNNLAWLLAQRGNGAEAIKLVGHALELAGPRPELLDTRGLCHLALKQSDKAVTDLQHAIKEGPTPIQYFHLARAQQSANNHEAASLALREARKRGLKRAGLHPIEEKNGGALVEELERQ